MLILLLIFAGLFLVGLFYFLRSDVPGSDRASAPTASIARMRKAGSRYDEGTDNRYEGFKEFDEEDRSQDLSIVIDDEFFYEETELERFSNPDTPEEERMMIAEALRRRGYQVDYPVNDDDEDRTGQEALDVSGMTDVTALRRMLLLPFRKEDEKELIRRRIAELEEDASAEEEGDDGSDADDDDSGGGYVNPYTYESVVDPHPDIPYQPDEGQVMGEWLYGDDGFAADDAVTKASILIMSKVIELFKNGRIPPELVMFAENKTRLSVDEGLLSEEDKRRGQARVGIYYRDPYYANMEIEDLGEYIEKAAVASEEEVADEEGTEPSVAEESSVETAVEGPRLRPDVPEHPPVQKRTDAEPVSTYFDPHGGKRDIFLQRFGDILMSS